jgi:hypothetical protein
MAQILLLGCYHFANPGQDVVNLQVPSVLTAQKQQELAEVCLRLANFAPTKIALEIVADKPNFETSLYDGFTQEKLLIEPNEREQIGLRLAHHLNHAVVYGIDEQSDTTDYFPFEAVQKFAQLHQQTKLLEACFADAKQFASEFEAKQHQHTICQLLRLLNAPDLAKKQMQQMYAPLLAIGNQAAQPGAELNAFWYLRNAKIVSKLCCLAKDNDRVLVVFGAGHLYWLRHCLELMSGFELIEATDYL